MVFDDLTLEQCVEQGVGPIVFPQRLAQGGYSPDECLRMKAVCVQNIQQQVHLQHILDLALHALEKAGIEAVLMKGVGLAALYPEPQQRPWGDIDLFVGTENYHAAAKVMRDTFPDARKFDEELDHYKHYNLIAEGVSIEVHRVTIDLPHPRDKRRYARMEEWGTVHAQPLTIGTLNVRVFEPTFNTLFVFLHSWEHMMTSGAILRQLCDLKLLLQHEKERIDRTKLASDLKALSLTDVWQLYMWILVERMGLAQADAPLYADKVSARAQRLLTDLLAGKMVMPSSHTQATTNRFVRKWRTMKERMKNAERIGIYSPSYAWHMKASIIRSGAKRLFAPDRHWE